MTAREPAWDKSLQLLLVLIVGFNIIPHTVEIPPWTTALSALCLVWKTLSLTRGVRLPNRYLSWVLVGAGTGGILIEYGTIIGQEPASALLVYLASMKLLETNRYRDAMLVVFTSYFLLMAHLLNSQSLLSTVFMGLDVLLITSLMFQLHKKDRRSSVRSFRPAMRMLALAIPVWIFLFLAFPRFSAGLWNFKTQQGSSMGFSTDLSPGSVEKLVESDEPAFRVNFTSNEIPIPETLYWRGAILNVSNGLRWTRSGPRDLPVERYEDTKSFGNPVDYEIWLEPIFQKWLFVLDYPSSLTTGERLQRHGIRRQPGFVYEANREIMNRSIYSATSVAQSPVIAMPKDAREIYLQLPKDLDPRIQELANRLKTQAFNSRHGDIPDESLMSNAVLRWFKAEQFRYTREPGALNATTGSAQLAQFLFERKRGFCEHYAAAYSTLMRSMGIPARVTVGFQGGKMNSFGRYLLVRSLDAHAWSEIWREDPANPGHGRWTRVDPTEVIAPLRLQLGGEFNQVDSQLLTGDFSQDDIRRGMERGFSGWAARIDLAWDAVQMEWNSFLLKYDFEYQRNLLKRIGMEGASRLVFMIWTVLGVLVFIVSLHIVLRKKAQREDPVLVAWHRFCATLERAGISRGRSEGPLAFAERAAGLQPRYAEPIRHLAREFIAIRYGQIPSEEQNSRFRQFRRLVGKFRREFSPVAQTPSP